MDSVRTPPSADY